MKNRKIYIAILLTVCMTVCTLPVEAACSEEGGRSSYLLQATKDIDTSFDLDFSQYSTWTIDFDNEAGLFRFNHTHVDVYYDGYTNASYAPTVNLTLQKLVGGDYETIETTTIGLGKIKTFKYPDGGTLTDYRLVFNASSKAVVTFSVMSYKE